uniref:Uncharacterized protein n=1 Tax=Solanum tuberosum TaxID=4113 RepID=M1DGV0_SOLTU
MSQPAGGEPFPVADLLTSTSEFPLLPSKASTATKLLNLCLPKEFSFAESLNQSAQQSHDSIRREFTLVGGIPQIKWTEEEVDRMNQIEELQFAVVGKFTHEWSGLEELRRIIPQQCDVKGLMLTKKHRWPWRGYLSLTYCPLFFVKECLFSLVVAVGKPLQIDQATANKSRPSCARVKVLVDLKKNFPKVVQMNIENEATGEVRYNMVAIKYDYVPKYCFDCKMQGHNNEECRMRKIPQPRDVENFQHDRGGGINNSDPRPIPAKLCYVHGF